MVCGSCGERIKPAVNKGEENVSCMNCGFVEKVRVLPLFIVTGASGVGKTTVVSELRRVMPDFDVFETDILWDGEAEKYRNNWLKVAYSIAQSGRGTILCGTMMPWDIEKCDYYPLFSHVYYLNLHCDDTTREARLRARPAWRNCGTEEFIEDHRKFAHWLIDNAPTAFNPPMPTVDTTNNPVEEAASQIKDWVLKHWRDR
jgi:hypothetical protein